MKNRGITLIALVVTIVVLLILAGVSISMLTGENGIIKQASEAKEKTEIAEEKEIVELAAVGAASKNNYGEITEENLEIELNEMIGPRNEDYTLVKDGENFIVTYTDSGRSYIVDVNGNIKENDIAIVEPENPDDWEYTVENGVATLTKYLGDDEILIVPNYIDGIPVKQVGNGNSVIWDTNNTDCVESLLETSVYYEPYQIKIREINISEGIEIIANACFANIFSLEEVNISNSVNKIGTSAFRCGAYDPSTRAIIINIPKTVIYLGNYIVGHGDSIKVEYRDESEIPSTWEEDWNKSNSWFPSENVGVIWAQ